jgi:hypothetical protein
VHVEDTEFMSSNMRLLLVDYWYEINILFDIDALFEVEVDQPLLLLLLHYQKISICHVLSECSKIFTIIFTFLLVFAEDGDFFITVHERNGILSSHVFNLLV